MSVIFEATGLTARYGKIEAIHDVRLQVRQGQIVSVIGPNGAGKSTTLNAIMGILPPSSTVDGDITFEGQPLGRLTTAKRVALGIGLVPERRELFGSMSVADNLMLGAVSRRKHAGAAWFDQLDTVYAIFPRLKERAGQLAGTLSGGERQMLAVGRVLMAKPRMLMLDEPSLGLAPLVTREILAIVQRLRETGVSILLIEQNARAALQISDHAYVLETGRVTLEGSAADLATNDRIVQAYLGIGKQH